MTSLCQQKINFKFNQILFIYGQQFSYFRATGRQDGKTEAKGFLIRLTSRPFLSGQLPKGEKNHPKQGVRKTYERKVCCLRPCRRVPKNTPANQFNRPDEKAKEDKKNEQKRLHKTVSRKRMWAMPFRCPGCCFFPKAPEGFRRWFAKNVELVLLPGKRWLFFRFSISSVVVVVFPPDFCQSSWPLGRGQLPRARVLTRVLVQMKLFLLPGSCTCSFQRSFETLIDSLLNKLNYYFVIDNLSVPLGALFFRGKQNPLRAKEQRPVCSQLFDA